DQAELDERRSSFKRYLETRGAVLSQNTKFLPYYALPFISNPSIHPSFKDLFQDSWALKLKDKLKQFLSAALKPSNTPRLLNLYISPEYIQSVYAQLFNSQMRQSTDFTRPGTVSIFLFCPQTLQQIQSKGVTPCCPHLYYEKLKYRLDRRPGHIQFPLASSPRWVPLLYLYLCILLTLLFPFPNLTSGLGEFPLRDSLAHFLVNKETRVLQAYFNKDLLECHSTKQKTVLHLMRSDNEIIRHNMARLINAFASLAEGRAYLSQIPILLNLLTDTLKTEDKDSPTREIVLMALQKLSLRRSQQTAMIEDDLIGWLVDELQHSDFLNDNTLMYSTALLMNLCLRTKGKWKCAENAKHVLKVLTDLLGHENSQIWPYVNGVLYNILYIPSVRQEAKEMSVEEILRCYSKDRNPHHNRQIKFIIEQLNSG
ncbi:unnamed protein product, partial [Tetraodon nigroviridis]